jgi:hypothetical protein
LPQSTQSSPRKAKKEDLFLYSSKYFEVLLNSVISVTSVAEKKKQKYFATEHTEHTEKKQ